VPNKVRWDELEPRPYEDMVAVLISRLHPNAQRIDGAGGDGGRDVLVPLADGDEIFELKSFTGRLNASRRQQVKRSLERAAQHSPRAWHLVVPIDPTPDELAWFTQLTAAYPFSCDWRDRTWLDSQMAGHPDIPRYFVEGAANEVFEMLRELNQEEAGLAGGALAAIDRVRTLTKRLNELDPYYAFDLGSTSDGGVTVTVMPKYRGAEEDRPITMHTSLRFPDTADGRRAARAFQDSVDYGTPSEVAGEYVTDFTIDLPAGLGGSFSGGELRLGIPEGSAAEDVRMVVRVVTSDDRTVAQLPLTGITRTGGVRGAELTLADITKSVTVVLRFDVDAKRVSMNYRFREPAEALPSAVLPAVRFIAELQPDRAVHLVIDGNVLAKATITDTAHEGAAGNAALLSDLDSLQSHSGVYFPVPSEFTEEELSALRTAARLLAGETVAGTWSELVLTVKAQGLAELRATGLEAGPVEGLSPTSHLGVTIAGHEMPLGLVRQTFNSARVRSWPEAPDSADPNADFDVVLVPGDDDSTSSVLVGERPTD
jgi:hypothetical protein